MVTDCHSIVANFIEDFRTFFPFGTIGNWQPLEGITRIHNKHFRIFSALFLNNSSQLSITDNAFFLYDAAMHIVSMENRSLWQIFRLGWCCSGFCRSWTSCILTICWLFFC